MIEKQRNVTSKLHSQDLNQTIMERKNEKEADQRARRQAMLNQIANAQIAALPSYTKVPDTNSAEKTLTDKLARDFKSPHIKDAMDEALNRYGTELAEIENEKTV